MASQLFADLYGCDVTILNSEKDIKEIARRVVSDIGAEIVEECIRVGAYQTFVCDVDKRNGNGTSQSEEEDDHDRVKHLFTQIGDLPRIDKRF